MASVTIGLTIIILVIVIFLTVAWFTAYYEGCPWELEHNMWKLFALIVIEVALAIVIANEACDSYHHHPHYHHTHPPCCH